MTHESNNTPGAPVNQLACCFIAFDIVGAFFRLLRHLWEDSRIDYWWEYTSGCSLREPAEDSFSYTDRVPPAVLTQGRGILGRTYKSFKNHGALLVSLCNLCGIKRSDVVTGTRAYSLNGQLRDERILGPCTLKR